MSRNHDLNMIEESDSEVSSLSSEVEVSNVNETGVHAYTASVHRHHTGDGEKFPAPPAVATGRKLSVDTSRSSLGTPPKSPRTPDTPSRVRKRTTTQESGNWLRRRSTALDPLQVGEGEGLSRTYSKVNTEKFVSDKLFGTDLMGGETKEDVEADQYGDLESINSEDVDFTDERSEMGGRLSYIASLKKTATDAIERKIGFLNPEFERFKLMLSFLRVYSIIGIIVMALFSLYWGTLYNRGSRLKNLKMLCVVEDDSESNYVTQCLKSTVESGQLAAMGHWELYNVSALYDKYPSDKPTEELVGHLIHRQEYWTSIYILPNASASLASAIRNQDASFDPSQLIKVIYETGRDILTMPSYVTTTVRILEKAFVANAARVVYPPILEQLTDKELSKTIKDAPGLLTTPIAFTYEDMRQMGSYVVQAPQQMGIVYLHILSFFQFNFFLGLHTEVAKKLKSGHFLVYRLASSQLSYLILSLFYCIVQACFRIPLNRSYSHGFAVLWMFTYLIMAAIGGANENMALICLATRPPYLGVWMLFWVIWNVAPTYSAFTLTPGFYKYGYAFPMHNGYELVKVILFDVSRHQMGRNIGVLVAWIVAMNCLLPFTVKYFLYKQRKK